MLFLVQHTRKCSSCSASEDKGAGQSASQRRRCPDGVSGACLCKLSGLIYLVGCVLVSALYVAIYGQSQQYFTSPEDVWVPGKVLTVTCIVCRCNLEIECSPREPLAVCVVTYCVLALGGVGSALNAAKKSLSLFSTHPHSQARNLLLHIFFNSVTLPTLSGLHSDGLIVISHSPTGRRSLAMWIPSSISPMAL